MKKNLFVLFEKELIQSRINDLDRNRIHILYFSYKLNFYNLYKNPFLIFTKLHNFFLGKKSIDHVAHISRFISDAEIGNWEAKIFEATMERGMEENYLFDKLKSFQGTCYIETLDRVVDKEKARKFEKEYTGVPYSKELAALSGLSININVKRNGGFCSWLEAIFLKDQGLDISGIENGDPFEITPVDIFNANFSEKKILYKS